MAIANSPEKVEWEYIIVGTGVGGATLGYRLAQAGKNVLFCEQGYSYIGSSAALTGDYAENFFLSPEAPQPKHEEILARSGRWSSLITDSSGERDKDHIPFIGAGSGGSSALYGGAMERFWHEDFEPLKWHKKAEESSLPEEWPVSYDEFEKYYDQAENLYRVRGGDDPLKVNQKLTSIAAPPQLSVANQHLSHFLKSRGAHPYRLPTACEFTPGCQTCQGFLCAQDCKNDSVKVCLKPAVELHGATLLDCCTVTRLESNGPRATGLIANWRGQEIRLRGNTIILAAGALATPMILLRSPKNTSSEGLANESGMVGRNLMRHCVDLYVLLSGVKPGPEENPKEIGFNDYYLHCGEKLGSVQSFGRLPPAGIITETLEQDLRNGPLPFTANLFKTAKPLARLFFSKALCNRLVLASTLEDLPYQENRVLPDSKSGIRFCYRIARYESQRIQRFRQLMKQTLKPWRFMLIKQAENNDRLAHVCGTCRMGDDPKNSVVNHFNCTHSIKNLYIVDSSFFPSSGGTNPSLTIAANALRVADHMLNMES